MWELNFSKIDENEREFVDRVVLNSGTPNSIKCRSFTDTSFMNIS